MPGAKVPLLLLAWPGRVPLSCQNGPHCPKMEASRHPQFQALKMTAFASEITAVFKNISENKIQKQASQQKPHEPTTKAQAVWAKP